jgi:hypothetical protein
LRCGLNVDGRPRADLVSKYTDMSIRARVAAAMAPAHQYQPPSVTAATIKPAASKTLRSCEPKSPPQAETLNSRYERFWAKDPQANSDESGGVVRSPGPRSVTSKLLGTTS